MSMSKISDWMNDAFLKWQTSHGRRKTISEFANHVGVSQPLMSNYLNGTRTPSGENVDKIADVLGDEIYRILELQPPDPNLQIIKRIWETLSESQQEQLRNQAENYAGQKEPKTP
jgi:transcriptional regulator with XRE-family HTH domain